MYTLKLTHHAMPWRHTRCDLPHPIDDCMRDMASSRFQQGDLWSTMEVVAVRSFVDCDL
jgi:hypothetical protein